MLNFDIEDAPPNDGKTSYRMIFFPSAFLQHLKHDSHDIHWDVWLPPSCRIFTGPFDSGCFVSTFGTRYATIENGEVVIYDFNPYFINRPFPEDAEHCEIIKEVSLTETPFYYIDIPSTLPYVKCRTGIAATGSPFDNSVVMTANGVVLCEVGT